jgi:cytochrome P450
MSEAEQVPAEIGALIVSPKAYASQRELLAGLNWLRQNNRLGRVQAEGFDPFWAVTTHADIVEVSRRHDLFNNGSRSTTLVPRATDELARSLTGGSPHIIRTLLEMDGVDHARHRHITQAWFARQNVGSFEGRIRAIARGAISQMAEHGDYCDFVREVASRFPLRVILDILGIPAKDEALLFDFLLELLRSQDEASDGGLRASRDPARHARRLLHAFTRFKAYFLPLMEERRNSPREDFASLVSVDGIGGKPIGQFEAVSYFILLVTAGYHTAAAAISGAVWAMCENVEQFRKVRADPALMPLLVEEAIRWTTPAHHMMRTATEDTVIHGRHIAKGDWLMLCYLSGNRDEHVFSEPEHFRVDLDRGRNLAFGYGAHVCLGQHLARLEMRIFFEELFRRVGRIEIAGVPRRSASVFLGGPRTLPVRFAML